MHFNIIVILTERSVFKFRGLFFAYCPSVEQLVDGVKETLGNLDLTDKKFIVKKIIIKIVATQKEATIWGQISILATEQVGLDVSNRHRRVAECW
jgi:hypothetical protein